MGLSQTVSSGWTDDEVTKETVKAVYDLFELVHRLEYNIGDFGEQTSCGVRFDNEAKARWVAWHDAHVAEAKQVPAYLQGPWHKMPTHLVRLTLILHVITTVASQANTFVASSQQDEPCPTLAAPRVTLKTLEAAIELVTYFKAHARRVFEYMRQQRGRSGDRRPALANGGPTVMDRIVEALRDCERLSENELNCQVFQGTCAADLRLALETLEVDGIIVRQVEHGRGRPTTFWRLQETRAQAAA